MDRGILKGALPRNMYPQTDPITQVHLNSFQEQSR